MGAPRPTRIEVNCDVDVEAGREELLLVVSFQVSPSPPAVHGKDTATGGRGAAVHIPLLAVDYAGPIWRGLPDFPPRC